MIQNIFLPEKIRNYYIFKQRILGIELGKTHIRAAVVSVRGSSISVDACVIEQVDSEKQNHAERIVAALTRIKEQVGRVSKVHISIPSSSVVFKEMRLPFINYDKISQVIRFEIEPLLPFSLQDALIDFIITDTRTDDQGQEAQVFVAATQRSVVIEPLSWCQQATIDPQVITIDTFALYGLYSEIKAYMSREGTVILLDIDMQSTRIIAIHNKQLRIIRTLSYGIYTIAKSASATTNTTPQQTLDHLSRFGFEKAGPPDFTQALQNSATEFFGKVQFALNSLLTQLHVTSPNSILVLGGSEIKGATKIVSEKLQSPCENFDIQKIVEGGRYKLNAPVASMQACLVAIATALPCSITQRFNVRRGELEPPQGMLLLKQIITSTILLIIIFASLITHSLIQTKRLNTEIRTSKIEIIDELKKRFSEIPEEEDDLDDVIESAKTALSQEQAVWIAFSSQSRASFLEYLLELTTRINKQELGFEPEQLTIVDGVKGEITLKAKVRDFEALKQLEQSLRKSKLFSYVESQKIPDFTMKIILARRA